MCKLWFNKCKNQSLELDVINTKNKRAEDNAVPKYKKTIKEVEQKLPCKI